MGIAVVEFPTTLHESTVPRPIALLAFLLCVAGPANASAQASSAASDSLRLHLDIAARDSALFDAFNRCDSAGLAGFFTADLEFYHDWNGQIGPRDQFVAGFSEACKRGELGRRELVAGSMEVHAMRNVGAVQVGLHRFFVRNPDGTEQPGSVARFVMLWRNTDDGWRISRVLSFAHRPQ